MGLTERHWLENEDVPENYEWALEDAVCNSRTNKKHDDDIVRCKECKNSGMETSDFISKSSLCKHLQVEIGSPEGNEYLMKVNNIIVKEPFVNQNNDCCKDKNEPLKISRDWVNEFYGYVAACPECDCLWIMYEDEDMKFCPGCGKKVEWE